MKKENSETFNNGIRQTSANNQNRQASPIGTKTSRSYWPVKEIQDKN